MSDPGTRLIEGIDYTVEDGKWVFTATYHQKRGFCCENVCLHCPFGNSPTDREPVANASVPCTNRGSE
ncbi:MAG: hypothetical protein C0467_25200 [Planctomycetaceae bacterium]|nr:hypothetical protein [Planctomycetaceae bacterium]